MSICGKGFPWGLVKDKRGMEVFGGTRKGNMPYNNNYSQWTFARKFRITKLIGFYAQ